MKHPRQRFLHRHSSKNLRKHALLDFDLNNSGKIATLQSTKPTSFVRLKTLRKKKSKKVFFFLSFAPLSRFRSRYPQFFASWLNFPQSKIHPLCSILKLKLRLILALDPMRLLRTPAVRITLTRLVRDAAKPLGSHWISWSCDYQRGPLYCWSIW